MSGQFKVTCDLYTIPYDDTDTVLYAPLTGFAGIVNQDVLSLISSIEKLDKESLNPEQRAAIDFLVQKGIINGSGEVNPVKPEPEKFAPKIVTLFPTNQCNLRCKYCYASAGDHKPITMDWNYAISAIDFVIKNAKEADSNQVVLGFHGGGEPLLPWNFIKKIVTYAEDCCAAENLKLSVNSATNGLLSEKQLEWALKHISYLNISFDGLPHVQDFQRPLPNGTGSFVFVDRTMRFLDEHDFKYGIRSTLSAYNIELMIESLDYINEHYKTKSVHFEPLHICGRCKTNDEFNPDLDRFAEMFMASEKKAVGYGMNFVYSGVRLETLTNSFCGVTKDNFSVTPDGCLTSCYEVPNKNDPRSETFFYGRINNDGGITIDEDKRQALHAYTVENLEYCKDCFARWHCGGECLAKIETGDYGGDRGHERCQLNRKLVANRLRKLVDGTLRPVTMVKCEEKTSEDK